MSYAQLGTLFTGSSSIDEKKRKTEEIYKCCGFGLIDLSGLDENGGQLKTSVTHYSVTWVEKFGHSEKLVDYFTTGWVSGALAAIYGFNLDDTQATQTVCMSMRGVQENVFEFKRDKSNFLINESVSIGSLREDHLIEVEENIVNYDGILEALTSMPILGNEEGLIPAFGVILTRHYANYYNRMSFEFLHAIRGKFGNEDLDASVPLLVEVVHQCAFYTFGGIMNSQEWDALIKPQLKTKEDWVHGIVATINALGWERWQVTDVSQEGGNLCD